MKKLTFILGIAAISLVACKKETTAIQAETLEDSLLLSESPNAHNEPSIIDPTQAPASAQTTEQENMIADAKKNPLTSIALSESNYDFKDVKKGKSVEHKFEFTNTGKNPLIISAVKPACGCTAPDYSKDPILPGKKGFVNLKFDSSSFDGLQSKSAEVFANVENMPIVLSFTANVTP